MNEQVLSASDASHIRPADPVNSDALALPKALLSMLVVIGAYFAVGLSLSQLTDGVTIAGYEVAWSVFASLILSVGVMIWVKKTRGSLASIGFKRPDSYGRSILLALAGMVGVYVFAFIPVSTLAHFGYLPPITPSDMPFVVYGPDLTISLIFALLLMWPNAAFGEELLFRGFLQNNFERALGGEGWWTGLLAAAFVAVSFGVMHMPSQGVTGLLQTALAGVILGAVFLIGKRSLFPVVIMHGLINSSAFFLTAAQL